MMMPKKKKKQMKERRKRNENKSRVNGVINKLFHEENEIVNLHCLFPRLHSAGDHYMNHPITRKEAGVALACYFRKEN
jgi:hypothetical protein